jgi:hypothetical protein
VLIVDFLIEELEHTPLKVEYLKGGKALEGREPLKTSDNENVWEPLHKKSLVNW